jgi:hypothetical protein
MSINSSFEKIESEEQRQKMDIQLEGVRGPGRVDSIRDAWKTTGPDAVSMVTEA